MRFFIKRLIHQTSIFSLIASCLALAPALAHAEDAAKPPATTTSQANPPLQANPPPQAIPTPQPAPAPVTTSPSASAPTSPTVSPPMVSPPAVPNNQQAPAVTKDTTSPPADPSAFPDLTAVPTLVAMPKDPPEVQEVDLPAKQVIIISGDSSWEDSGPNLAGAFKKLTAAAEKVGNKPAGRPLAVFTKSTDDGFSYDAMIPLTEAPAAGAAPPGEGMRYGLVPSGKALRFIHKDPYELISSTYEGAALYIENKNLVSKEELIEEYVTDISNQSDKNTIVNIYIPLVGKNGEPVPEKK